MEKDHKGNDGEIRNAVALRYREGVDSAPVVTASGRGWLAERIIQVARQNGIPVYEDKSLAGLLKIIHVDEEIPVELYEAVATVLAFVIKVDNMKKESREK